MATDLEPDDLPNDLPNDLPDRLPGDLHPIAAAIAAAEEITDPLDGLVERTAKDAGAPLVPETLARLAGLRREDGAAFEALRARLKRAGARVSVLDHALAELPGEGGGRPTQADRLIALADAAALFHAPDGSAFADVMIDGHRETWPVRARGFRLWLTRQFFEETGGAPGAEALASALGVVEAKACFEAPERRVFVRIGGLDGRLYLDLCDTTWRAVEIDTSGWRVVDAPPVRFRRAAGAQPLPVPVAGGSIEALRRFLNVRPDTDFVLAVAWATAVLRDRGPYPLIVLAGEQGSAKSTFSAILRALLDPCKPPLRALPREDRDLFIAAANAHLLVFDNVSGLPGWLSDTLCRLSTGGGFAVRQLYCDQDEVLFDAVRPIILNGIEDIVSRPDLADRAIFLTLEPIPEDQRRPEAELWAGFEAARPAILGALLDAVVEGLRRLPGIQLSGLPRMADFALWASACETALWPEGTFRSAYDGNREAAVEDVIEADPVAAALRNVMETRTVWTGTASDLLDALAEMAGERITKTKTWPATPRGLSGRLRRAATALRKVGIEIDFAREGRARARMIRITSTPHGAERNKEGARPSASSAPSAPEANGRRAGALAAGQVRTVEPPGPLPPSAMATTVRARAADSADVTDADGADAKLAPASGPEPDTSRSWRRRL